MKVRLGTRGSRLALVQSESVAARLRQLGVLVETVPIRTSGDRLAQVALADFGGKALFVKEIEEALLDGHIDIAVHSLKDLPTILPEGLAIGAYPAREDARDVLVTRGGTFESLPAGGAVGTSSLRRRVLVLRRRPDVRVEPIRGNVDTRLTKLDQGLYDALILAKAGLDRLGIARADATALAVDEFVPAVGQGMLAVEVREADRQTLELLAGVDDTRTRMAAVAERAYLEALEADCHTPVAGHARFEGDHIVMTGLVASLDGQTVLSSSRKGTPSEAAGLGTELARDLLSQGARSLLGKSVG